MGLIVEYSLLTCEDISEIGLSRSVPQDPVSQEKELKDLNASTSIRVKLEKEDFHIMCFFKLARKVSSIIYNVAKPSH